MKNVRFMTLTALLTAIAIFIPIAMPLKLVIPPASYTLGSHVAIFIAMFYEDGAFHPQQVLRILSQSYILRVIGHLCRSWILIRVLYLWRLSACDCLPCIVTYSLCDTWGLFLTKASKDA